MMIILHFSQESDDMDKRQSLRQKSLSRYFIRIIFIPYPDKKFSIIGKLRLRKIKSLKVTQFTESGLESKFVCPKPV